MLQPGNARRPHSSFRLLTLSIDGQPRGPDPETEQKRIREIIAVRRETRELRRDLLGLRKMIDDIRDRIAADDIAPDDGEPHDE